MIQKEFMLRMKNALTDTYVAIETLVLDTIDEIDNKEMYHVSIHPFELQRKDNTPIPADVLTKVQNLWTIKKISL